MLKLGVSSISDLINVQGYVNLDFADITAVMRGAGLAHMGIGIAEGENMATEAANKAIHSQLIETSINGATGVIISIVSSEDIKLDDVETEKQESENYYQYQAPQYQPQYQYQPQQYQQQYQPMQKPSYYSGTLYQQEQRDYRPFVPDVDLSARSTMPPNP